jgi:hypothetical protein
MLLRSQNLSSISAVHHRFPAVCASLSAFACMEKGIQSGIFDACSVANEGLLE